MYREPNPMREIRDIQKRLYEEERNLTNEELIAKNSPRIASSNKKV